MPTSESGKPHPTKNDEISPISEKPSPQAPRPRCGAIGGVIIHCGSGAVGSGSSWDAVDRVDGTRRQARERGRRDARDARLGLNRVLEVDIRGRRLLQTGCGAPGAADRLLGGPAHAVTVASSVARPGAPALGSTWISVTGSVESAPKPRVDGRAPGHDQLGGERRDHRAVVGAQRQRRDADGHAGGIRPLERDVAQPPVGDDAPAEQQAGHPVAVRRRRGPW